jgi:2-keto-4-pentenoate hydratase/2-oxohepta-3-ene-1,7-dioic acid hydratase in catechol pathway
MSNFSRLIKFESASDGEIYFADLGAGRASLPTKGSHIKGYSSVEELSLDKSGIDVKIGALLAPVPFQGVPIYCVGLNYKSHAEEAKVRYLYPSVPQRISLITDYLVQLKIPAAPPLWTKPATSLANPDEDIPMNKFCASTLPDYEAELVFVTSRQCKDVSASEASSYILGYTAGNDLSCRLHQMPDQAGGQFFFAKAFDKFAPIGPILLSPQIFNDGKGLKLIARVNGKVRQEADLSKDMIFSPAQILSRMSQGTTIPAGTAVMTGTPAGVGAFMSPKTFLNNGDEVEVEITNIGVLKNKIVFS